MASVGQGSPPRRESGPSKESLGFWSSTTLLNILPQPLPPSAPLSPRSKRTPPSLLPKIPGITDFIPLQPWKYKLQDHRTLLPQDPPHLQLHSGPCSPVDSIESCSQECNHQQIEQDPHRPHPGLLAQGPHRSLAQHHSFLQLHLRPGKMSIWAQFPQALQVVQSPLLDLNRYSNTPLRTPTVLVPVPPWSSRGRFRSPGPTPPQPHPAPPSPAF